MQRSESVRDAAATRSQSSETGEVMREVITPTARRQIADRVKLARRLYRDAEQAEREIMWILSPAGPAEAETISDAVLSSTANEKHSVAKMLRDLGVKVKRQ
jgi:DNA-binding TFAR19-related protein (PDSD5 family)